MLVVLASRADTTAAGLVSAWAAHNSALFTVDDLSRAGWSHRVGEGIADTAVIGGRVVAAGEIDGVLIRMPAVTVADLSHIAPEDRSYVAMEMTAFLVAWLSSLSCPVINRPRPACLVGPNWRESQWVDLAAELGMRVRPMRRLCAPGIQLTPDVLEGAPAAVTVIGDRRLGVADETLKQHAARLARAAGVELVTVLFSDPSASAEFLGVSLCPDLSLPEVADAVLGFFKGGAA